MKEVEPIPKHSLTGGPKAAKELLLVVWEEVRVCVANGFKPVGPDFKWLAEHRPLHGHEN